MAAPRGWGAVQTAGTSPAALAAPGNKESRRPPWEIGGRRGRVVSRERSQLGRRERLPFPAGADWSSAGGGGAVSKISACPSSCWTTPSRTQPYPPHRAAKTKGRVRLQRFHAGDADAGDGPGQVEQHAGQVGQQPEHRDHHVPDGVEGVVFAEGDNGNPARQHVEQRNVPKLLIRAMVTRLLGMYCPMLEWKRRKLGYQTLPLKARAGVQNRVVGGQARRRRTGRTGRSRCR